MTLPADLSTAIRLQLAAPLPGAWFHELMLPPWRRGMPPPENTAKAAVLVAVTERLEILLIERTGGGPHGGQIAFPGGTIEATDASREAAALREANEETGLDPGSIAVLGTLSPLTIYVSRYEVTPVVGFTPRFGNLKANPAEAASILVLSLRDIFDPRHKGERDFPVRGETIRAPCYIVGDVLIWGATAMILRELEEVLVRANVLRP